MFKSILLSVLGLTASVAAVADWLTFADQGVSILAKLVGLFVSVVIAVKHKQHSKQVLTFISSIFKK